MEDCTKTTRFLKALNGGGNKGGNKGGLFCQLKDQELNKYVMTLAEDFQRNSPDALEKPKIAPSHHGRQEDDIWVLNDNCQIDAAGNLLNLDDSPYEWLAGTTGENVFDKLKSKIQLPPRKKSLSLALRKLKVAVPGMHIVCTNIIYYYRWASW